MLARLPFKALAERKQKTGFVQLLHNRAALCKSSQAQPS